MWGSIRGRSFPVRRTVEANRGTTTRHQRGLECYSVLCCAAVLQWTRSVVSVRPSVRPSVWATPVNIRDVVTRPESGRRRRLCAFSTHGCVSLVRDSKSRLGSESLIATEIWYQSDSR
jgi:hypothetical protein